MQPDRTFWAGRPVCVTGGTGFLGYHLVRQLLDLGAAVRVLALRPAPAHPLWREPRVEAFYGDLLDADVVCRAVAGCDVVFHAAGVVAVGGQDHHRMHAVHVDGTRHVLDAAGPRARVVHTSSVVAVGASPTRHSLTEERAFNLHDFGVDYVQAKRAAEEVAHAAARRLDVLVTNPAYLIGPDDHEQSVMGRFCVRFWKGRVLLTPPGGLNLADVRDVACGHLLAAERGRRGHRYILGGENRTYRQFLELLAEVAGLHPRALPAAPHWAWSALAGLSECRAALTGRDAFPSYQHVRLNRYYWYYRSERAESELGYRCRPLVESLADSYRWHAEAGMAPARGLSRWWLRPEGRAA
jgi:dihydroflavonol-4-reductase